MKTRTFQVSFILTVNAETLPDDDASACTDVEELAARIWDDGKAEVRLEESFASGEDRAAVIDSVTFTAEEVHG